MEDLCNSVPFIKMSTLLNPRVAPQGINDMQSLMGRVFS